MIGDDKTDLRVIKTKNALLDAMMTLLKAKPLEKITVSDLCEAASIRRATFYAHFRDKEDFLHYCLRKKKQRFSIDCEQEDFLSDAFFRATIRSLICFLRENRPLMGARAADPDGLGAVPLLNRRFASAIEQIMRKGVRVCDPSVSPGVLASFITGSVIGVVRWYCEEGAPMAEDEFVGQVCHILHGCVTTLMERPAPTPAHDPLNQKGEIV